MRSMRKQQPRTRPGRHRSVAELIISQGRSRTPRRGSAARHLRGPEPDVDVRSAPCYNPPVTNQALDAINDGMQHALAELRHPLADLESAVPEVEYLRGLLGFLESRVGTAGRLLGLGMLRGLSMRQASFRAGVSDQTVRDWVRKDPELRRAVLDLEGWRAATVEDEVTRRAFAGSEDRGSMRALELLAKATMPEYRDKHQVELTVRHAAEQAQSAATSGWKRDDSASS